MQSLLDYLEEINGEIDEFVEDQSKKYFLKIRGSIRQEILNRYDWSVPVKKTDIFLDDSGLTNLRQKKIYRDRDGIVEQSSEHIQGNSHWYSEKKLEGEERASFDKLGLMQYLSFDFDRKSCIVYDKSSLSGLYHEVFHDTIVRPVHYDLLTWKIQIRSTSLEAVRVAVDSLKIPQFQPLPVFAKFMYVLQCSPHFPLYEELFEKSLGYVEVSMKQRMTTDVSQANSDSQHYLWSFGQVVHFQCLFNELKNLGEVYIALSKMKQQVDRNVERNEFGLTIPDEEDEESFCP